MRALEPTELPDFPAFAWEFLTSANVDDMGFPTIPGASLIYAQANHGGRVVASLVWLVDELRDEMTDDQIEDYIRSDVVESVVRLIEDEQEEIARLTDGRRSA